MFRTPPRSTAETAVGNLHPTARTLRKNAASGKPPGGRNAAPEAVGRQKQNGARLGSRPPETPGRKYRVRQKRRTARKPSARNLVSQNQEPERTAGGADAATARILSLQTSPCSSRPKTDKRWRRTPYQWSEKSPP